MWERTLSRKRDRQLDQTHRRLIAQRMQTRMLIRTIRRNTRVVERFEQTQRLVIHLLERMPHETHEHEAEDHRAGRRAG